MESAFKIKIIQTIWYKNILHKHFRISIFNLQSPFLCKVNSIQVVYKKWLFRPHDWMFLTVIHFFQRERFDPIFLKWHFPISADEKATIDTIVFISVASRTAALLYANNKTINIHPDPCTMPQMLHHSKSLYRLTLIKVMANSQPLSL